MEYRSRSVRLSDEVWEALQSGEFSANQLLRDALLGKPITPEIEKRIAAQVRPRKLKLSEKKEAALEGLERDFPATMGVRSVDDPKPKFVPPPRFLKRKTQ